MKRVHRLEGEDGFVLAWFALLLVPLLLMAAFSIDIGNWYLTANREQKAADAASLAGVVYMPSDFAKATAEATAVAETNGFSAAKGDTVVVERTRKPNQLRVTITRTVDTFFARVVGYDRQTITRSAVAEFQGPTAMGSPSNSLGNEPVIPQQGEQAWRDTPDPVADNPQHWIEISGPQTPKIQGDRFSANNCSSGPYLCSGSNQEYSADGYYYVVRANVGPAQAGKYLAVELFDPGWFSTGDACTDGNFATAFELDPVRYSRSQAPISPFCTGDSGSGVVRTDFQLFQPVPKDEYGSVKVPIGSCGRGWNGFNGNIKNEIQANPGGAVATAMHRWVQLCRVQLPSTPGVYDYVLNVKASGGSGHNRYAIRTGVYPGSGSTGRPDATRTSVFAAGRLPIYANLNDATTTFYLARVLPGAGGSTLKIEFYDTGDASKQGTIRVVLPGGRRPDRPCTTSKSDGGSLSTTDNGCTITNVISSNGFDGRLVRMDLPIPADYACDQADPLDCWVKVIFQYPPDSGVRDTTTWVAYLDGDPVRLVE